MHYPDIDRYAGMDSPVHRFEPRIKIISFTILIFSTVFVESIPVALAGVAIAALILLASRLPLRFIMRRSKVILIFVLPVLILMPLTVPGTPLLSAGPLVFSKEGLACALLITLRAVAAILLVLTLLGSQRFETTLRALALLRVPGPLIQMLLFTYRYIFVMIDEFLGIWSAMRAKGFSFRTNRYGLTIVGNLVGMLIIKSYERAERVYQAMIAKGYTGKPITFAPFSISAADCLAAVLLVGLAIGLHLIPPVIV